MVTPTEPKPWKQEIGILAEVPPAHLPRNRRPGFVTTKKVRLQIVRKHLPDISKADKEKVVEGLEMAVRKFLIAANIDGRPLPANIRVRMEVLEKTAQEMLHKLQDCDDLSWEVIKQKAAATPPPSPKPMEGKGKSKLTDALFTPIEIESMDPPDRIIEQLEQYATMFSKLTKSAGAMSNNRRATALPVFFIELKLVWKNATGNDC